MTCGRRHHRRLATTSAQNRLRPGRLLVSSRAGSRPSIVRPLAGKDRINFENVREGTRGAFSVLRGGFSVARRAPSNAAGSAAVAGRTPSSGSAADRRRTLAVSSARRRTRASWSPTSSALGDTALCAFNDQRGYQRYALRRFDVVEVDAGGSSRRFAAWTGTPSPSAEPRTQRRRRPAHRGASRRDPRALGDSSNSGTRRRFEGPVGAGRVVARRRADGRGDARRGPGPTRRPQAARPPLQLARR
jgi:hypothetical protein